MAEPNWKKAQERVGKCLKGFMDTRKDFYYKRFTDTYEAGGTVVQNQPSDIWFIYRGKFAICEIKSSEYKDKFYFKDVRPSQWVGATRIIASGGHSMFLLVNLPSWQWYYASGQMMLEVRASGDPGIKWEELTPIKLTAENILQVSGLA